jgi:hypothetical protein
LIFSFVGQLKFECHSLTQEMSSVIHYLPCFREWLFTHPLSVFTAFPVFVYRYFGTEISSLPFTLSLVHFQCSTSPLHCCVRLQCTVCCCSVFGGKISLPRDWAGLCSQESIGKFHIVHGAHLFVLSIDMHQV